MKNKKADFTLGETMKIILAVISIGMLLYLAVSMYGLFTKKSEIQQARATLAGIKETINKLEEGKTASYLLQSPNKWVLVYYENSDLGIPQLCNGKNCLCICNYRGQNPDCDSYGVCENIENIEKTSEITLGTMINIKDIYFSKVNGKIFIERKAGAYQKSEDIFEKLLEHKINENSKSVEELSVEYITDLTQKKIDSVGLNTYSQDDDLTKTIKSSFGENGAFNFEIRDSKGIVVFNRFGVNPGNAESNSKEHEKEIVNAKGEKYKIYLRTYGVE